MTFYEWIQSHYQNKEAARLKCAEATAAMVSAFPELRRVRGHAFVGLDYRPHWWCIDSDGTIIDPTAHQWETPPAGYDELPADAEEPHGKCHECGALLYRSKGAQSYFCEECA